MPRFMCNYIAGTCEHPECDPRRQDEPRPTVEEYCASDGHVYDGDTITRDGVEIGRCYCGARTYPHGGPK